MKMENQRAIWRIRVRFTSIACEGFNKKETIKRNTEINQRAERAVQAQEPGAAAAWSCDTAKWQRLGGGWGAVGAVAALPSPQISLSA